MGYTAGADVAEGAAITGSKWNNYNGASGSVDYLKSEMDRLHTATQTDATGSRVLGTEYQNTSGSPLFVTVTAQVDGVFNGVAIAAYSDDNTPPVDEVARASLDTSSAEVDRAHVTFIVPNAYYYKVVNADGNAALVAWIETELHS
jgi:hypothetical protein